MGREWPGEGPEEDFCPGQQKPQNLVGRSWALDVDRASQEQGKAREMGRVEAKGVGSDPE